MIKSLHLKDWKKRNYLELSQKMQLFTDCRTRNNYQIQDECWLVEHYPVYTLGLSKGYQHLSDDRDIAIQIVETNRGGKVTYHGPGQLVMYLLFDIRSLDITVTQFVRMVEESLIELLQLYDINANRIDGIPGIYVEEAKIASLGFRISKGFSFHGISLNVDMDLSPFETINPCGMEALKMTQMSELTDKPLSQTKIGHQLFFILGKLFEYTEVSVLKSFNELVGTEGQFIC